MFSEGLETGDETGAGPSRIDEIGMAGRRQDWDKDSYKSTIHEDSGEMQC